MQPLSDWHRARLPGLVMGLAGAAVGPGVASAETPGAACLDIADAAQRLACFDRAISAAVHRATAAVPPAPAAPERAKEGGAAPPRPASLIDAAWGFLPDSKPAYVRLHDPNYILFGRYTTDVNTEPYQPLFDAFAEEGDFENVEAKFQLSLKGRLATTDDHRWGLWFAYTQLSLWQVYSPDLSSPFRETNFEPEIFGSFRPGIGVGGMQWNLLNFGYNHQSNGRSDPISRSWDRRFVEAGFERDNFVLLARAWTRINSPDDEDDNPDILDYYGYGESMIDYNWNQTTIGLGVTINDRF